MILPGTGRGTAPEGRGGGGASLRKPAVYAARKLRRQLSPPEVLLWSQLKGNKLGFKVRRQHPIGQYVADFYVRDAKLVIEVDGNAHDFGDRPMRDVARDDYMTSAGYRIFRITAFQVMADLDSVLIAIAEQVASPLHHAAHGPPPQGGEDQE